MSNDHSPLIYGPEPPIRDDFVWIIMERKLKERKEASETALVQHTPVVPKIIVTSPPPTENQNTDIAQANQNHSPTAIATATESDGTSHFKILSCLDREKRTLTTWDHSPTTGPMKYVSSMSPAVSAPSSTKSFGSLLAESTSKLFN